jgi:glycine/D-amino acid oxidase-like deaminating enzyme
MCFAVTAPEAGPVSTSSSAPASGSRNLLETLGYKIPLISQRGYHVHHPNLWCAFGHGHLGLTRSANTAKLIANALKRNFVENEIPMFSADRFS